MRITLSKDETADALRKIFADQVPAGYELADVEINQYRTDSDFCRIDFHKPEPVDTRTTEAPTE